MFHVPASAVQFLFNITFMNELKYNKAYLSPVNMMVILVPLCGQDSFILMALTRPAAANTLVERLRTLGIDLIQAKVTCSTH